MLVQPDGSWNVFQLLARLEENAAPDAVLAAVATGNDDIIDAALRVTVRPSDAIYGATRETVEQRALVRKDRRRRARLRWIDDTPATREAAQSWESTITVITAMSTGSMTMSVAAVAAALVAAFDAPAWAASSDIPVNFLLGKNVVESASYHRIAGIIPTADNGLLDSMPRLVETKSFFTGTSGVALFKQHGDLTPLDQDVETGRIQESAFVEYKNNQTIPERKADEWPMWYAAKIVSNPVEYADMYAFISRKLYEDTTFMERLKDDLAKQMIAQGVPIGAMVIMAGMVSFGFNIRYPNRHDMSPLRGVVSMHTMRKLENLLLLLLAWKAKALSPVIFLLMECLYGSIFFFGGRDRAARIARFGVTHPELALDDVFSDNVAPLENPEAAGMRSLLKHARIAPLGSDKATHEQALKALMTTVNHVFAGGANDQFFTEPPTTTDKFGAVVLLGPTELNAARNTVPAIEQFIDASATGMSLVGLVAVMRSLCRLSTDVAFNDLEKLLVATDNYIGLVVPASLASALFYSVYSQWGVPDARALRSRLEWSNLERLATNAPTGPAPSMFSANNPLVTFPPANEPLGRFQTWIESYNAAAGAGGLQWFAPKGDDIGAKLRRAYMDVRYLATRLCTISISNQTQGTLKAMYRDAVAALGVGLPRDLARAVVADNIAIKPFVNILLGVFEPKLVKWKETGYGKRFTLAAYMLVYGVAHDIGFIALPTFS
jgi:hypothetical protein